MAKSKYNDLVEEMAMGSYDEDFDLMQKRQAQMQREQQMLQAQSQDTTSQNSGVGQAGSALTTGGMAAANPYVAGAGLTLQAIGMVDNAKRKNEQAKIDAYNNKIMAQRAAIRNMFG